MYFSSAAFLDPTTNGNLSSSSSSTVITPEPDMKYDGGGPDGGILQEKEVLIPSCIESGFSGVAEQNVTGMLFKRTLQLPDEWADDVSSGRRRVLVHFEAVDYEATVFVNEHKLIHNIGGYFRFSVDVTNSLNKGEGETNELQVVVRDPTDQPNYYTPHGKQTRTPSHIFYTPCTGIWQSVWWESVPADGYVSELEVAGDMDGKGKWTNLAYLGWFGG